MNYAINRNSLRRDLMAGIIINISLKLDDEIVNLIEFNQFREHQIQLEEIRM